MNTTTLNIITMAVVAVTAVPMKAQEKSRAQTIKETLKGQDPPKFKTRGLTTGGGTGFTTRGITPPPPQKEIQTRTLYLSRGASPKAAFFGDEMTTVTEVKAPSYNPNPGAKGDLGVNPGEEAYKVEYKVDPTSKLRGEVFFHKGSDQILSGSGSLSFLNDLSTALKDPELQDYKFVIEGHASAEGSAVSNKHLSQKRADAIHNLLVEFGVSGNRIFPAGFGEDEARFPDGSPEKSLAQDRRVLIYKLED